MSDEIQTVLDSSANNWFAGKLAAAGLDLRHEIARMRAWLSKGFLAILDQALISGSNFALGISLARWGGPKYYGAYMTAFATFLLIANIYQALLLEPSLVLGFSLFPERNSRYIRRLLRLHLIFTCAFIAVAGTAVLVATRLHVEDSLASAFSGLLLSTPCVLLFWLARNFAYLEFSPGRAVTGSVTYCIILSVSFLRFHLTGGLTPFRVFLCCAIAALGASMMILFRYRRASAAAEHESSLGAVWTGHWRLGRWGLGTVGMNWVQSNSLSVTSGYFLGLSGIGGLNALVAMLLPMIQVLFSIARTVGPRISQIFTRYGMKATQRPVIRVALVFFALITAYISFLAAFHNQIFHLVYGQRFMPYSYLLPVISIQLLGVGAMVTCDTAFYATQQPQAPIRIKLFMMAVTILVTTGMSWRFGLPGAAVAVPLCSGVTGLLMALKLRSYWRQHAGSPAS